jgi:hypothetical protein
MARRRFDHLVLEISLAVGELIPRYPLWLRLHELGWNPERLSPQATIAFCGAPLTRFLADHGLALSGRARRRLERNLRRYDPAIPTPYERMARI